MSYFKHALLAAGALACKQVEVVKISNEGIITDYQTDSDEIAMFIGAGSTVMYMYEHDFTPYMSVRFPRGQITFPCLTGDVIYWEALEIDEVTSEKA